MRMLLLALLLACGGSSRAPASPVPNPRPPEVSRIVSWTEQQFAVHDGVYDDPSVGGRAMLEGSADWVCAHKRALHIVGVIQKGDWVQSGWLPETSDWEHAQHSVAAKFLACGLPLVIAQGNHDTAGPGSLTPDPDHYQRSFQRFVGGEYDQLAHEGRGQSTAQCKPRPDGTGFRCKDRLELHWGRCAQGAPPCLLEKSPLSNPVAGRRTVFEPSRDVAFLFTPRIGVIALNWFEGISLPAQEAEQWVASVVDAHPHVDWIVMQHALIYPELGIACGTWPGLCALEKRPNVVVMTGGHWTPKGGNQYEQQVRRVSGKPVALRIFANFQSLGKAGSWRRGYSAVSNFGWMSLLEFDFRRGLVGSFSFRPPAANPHGTHIPGRFGSGEYDYRHQDRAPVKLLPTQ